MTNLLRLVESELNNSCPYGELQQCKEFENKVEAFGRIESEHVFQYNCKQTGILW